MIKVGQYVHWAGVGGAEDLVVDEIKYANREELEYVFFTEEKAGYSLTLGELDRMGVKIVRVSKETPQDFKTAYQQEQIDILNVKSCGDTQAGYAAALDLDLPIVDVAACVAFSKGWEIKSSRVTPVYLCEKHWVHGSNGNPNFRVINAGVDVKSLQSVLSDRSLNDYKKAAKSRWGLDPNKPVVGWLGRFDQFKCPFTFVDIAKVILSSRKDCQFIMFGDGHDLGRAQYLISRDKLDIKTTGFTRDKAPAFGCMDVYCMPTWQEAFGRVYAEAMAIGTPIVTSNYPVSMEVCGDAALYSEFSRKDPMDVDKTIEFANHCVRLLGDDDNRSRMSAAGMARALEHYDAEKMTKKYEILYKEILGR